MQTVTAPTDLARERDLRGRHRQVWFRRGALAVMGAVVIAALGGVIGQDPRERVAGGDAAELRVRAATTLRGGLLAPVRIEIRARRRITAPQLVLGPGFIEGMQLNSLEPAPTAETSRRGDGDERAGLALTYPTLEAGDELTVYLQLQVNPTTIGRLDMGVGLEGADVAPVRSPATLTVLP